jgi:hypothetical protein
MKIIRDKINLAELNQMAQKFGDFVKAVVDVRLEIMALDGDLHADEETLLIENGSKQEDLWGINLYPKMDRDSFIEFDSMINLRPTQGNLTRGVDDPLIKEKIAKIINNLVNL